MIIIAKTSIKNRKNSKGYIFNEQNNVGIIIKELNLIGTENTNNRYEY